METAITVITAVLWLVGVLGFLCGMYLVVNMKEISVGKGAGRFTASIVGTVTFFGVADLAYFDDWVDFIKIEAGWLKVIIVIAFVLLVLGCLFVFIDNWSNEWKKVKEDPNILGVIVAFSVSGVCLGIVA